MLRVGVGVFLGMCEASCNFFKIKKSADQPESLSLLTSSPTNDFSNEDVYAFARELEQLHPDNRHVKDKIRQQLQVLRDAGFLIHVSSGVWRLP